MKIFLRGHFSSSADSRRAVNGEKCTLSTGKLSAGGLLRNSVVKITDLLDITSAVYHGREAKIKQNQNLTDKILPFCGLFQK